LCKSCRTSCKFCRSCDGGLTGGRTSNLSEPARNLVRLILSDVDVDDGHRQERRQRYEDHVQTEVSAFNTHQTTAAVTGVEVGPETQTHQRRDSTVELSRVGVARCVLNSQLAHDDCRWI